jgi:hypothetical protein
MDRADDSIAVLRERVSALDRLTDSRLTAQAEMVKLALDSSKEAIIKAETATEKRFESVNEFRAQLSDQTHSFLPRAEGGQRMDAMQKEIDELRAEIGAMREGTANLAGRLAVVGAVVTVLISLVVVAANALL